MSKRPYDCLTTLQLAADLPQTRAASAAAPLPHSSSLEARTQRISEQQRHDMARSSYGCRRGIGVLVDGDRLDNAGLGRRLLVLHALRQHAVCRTAP